MSRQKSATSSREKATLERELRQQLGPIGWAKKFLRYLELEGVWTGRGPKPQLEGTISDTVSEIAARFGVNERTARRRLKLARDLEEFPELAERVDRGELMPRAALLEAGVLTMGKPDLGDGVSHPARFSGDLLEAFAEVLVGYNKILDPFAGTGLIHELQEFGHRTSGIELEPEWAELHEDTEIGDARELPFRDRSFDAICTSPTFGNRMADHHDAYDASTRRSYTHDLGRKLSEGNSGLLGWGPKYREFHEEAWDEAVRVLRPKGRFVLNIKDHIRKGRQQFVAGWHVTTLCSFGLTLLFHIEVDAAGMRAGSNGDLRCPELVYVFERGTQ
jgi:SAM-dependent methyltransferase